jgi:DNA-binding MarR family transcriptional regulator
MLPDDYRPATFGISSRACYDAVMLKTNAPPQDVAKTGGAMSFPADRQWRRANISRLLFSAAWRFDSRILDYVNRHGFPALRMAHLHVPRNLDLEGTRVTELAARAEMSKQAMSEIVDECVAMGLIRRLPDPTDRRAKIVGFTPRGLELIAAVRAALTAAQREMRTIIGSDTLDAVATALADYAEATPRNDAAPRRIIRSR